MRACLQCDGTVAAATETHTLVAGGVEFVVTLAGYACRECREHYTPGPQLELFELRAAIWLTSHGVRTGDALRFARKSLGLRATDLAKLLGVAPETISRWETGERDVPPTTFGLMGALVAERLEGREQTAERMRAIASPEALPAEPVELEGAA